MSCCAPKRAPLTRGSGPRTYSRSASMHTKGHATRQSAARVRWPSSTALAYVSLQPLILTVAASHTQSGSPSCMGLQLLILILQGGSLMHGVAAPHARGCSSVAALTADPMRSLWSMPGR